MSILSWEPTATPPKRDFANLLVKVIYSVTHSVIYSYYSVTKQLLEGHAESLLGNLFSAMTHKGSSENEYVMKSIMRCMSVLQEKIIPIVETLVSEFTAKLLLVAKVTSFLLALVIHSFCFINEKRLGNFEVPSVGYAFYILPDILEERSLWAARDILEDRLPQQNLRILPQCTVLH